MAKKDFSKVNNPATPSKTAVQSFIDPAPATSSSKGGRPRIEGETRSRRVNILMEPSKAYDLKNLAALNRTSVNNLINGLVEAYINENRKALDQFKNLDAKFPGEQ